MEKVARDSSVKRDAISLKDPEEKLVHVITQPPHFKVPLPTSLLCAL